MIREAVVTIGLTDFWLSGTGRAGAGDVDAVAHRDRYGCPALPMSQVKGLLRESADRLAKTKDSVWTTTRIIELFGAEGQDEAALAFRGEATLGQTAGEWFFANKGAREQLFRRISSTRIGASGVALDKTLRSVEVAVPLTLTGRVYWDASDGPDPNMDWPSLLDAACAVTLAFGKHKTDGFGRAMASCRGILP